MTQSYKKKQVRFIGNQKCWQSPLDYYDTNIIILHGALIVSLCAATFRDTDQRHHVTTYLVRFHKQTDVYRCSDGLASWTHCQPGRSQRHSPSLAGSRSERSFRCHHSLSSRSNPWLVSFPGDTRIQVHKHMWCVATVTYEASSLNWYFTVTSLTLVFKPVT